MESAESSPNFAARDLAGSQSSLANLQASLQTAEAQLQELRARVSAQSAAKDAFGRQGIQSFVVEGVLSELQVGLDPGTLGSW